jgi:hypothetical protein
MLGDDGTDFYTRVPAIKWAWACDHVLSCQVVNATTSRDATLGKNYPILEAPGWSAWMVDHAPGRGGRQARQTSAKILLAHIYRNEEM